MECYILDSGFLKTALIDQFFSMIWTERYTDAPDATLVVAATPENIARLAEGTFLFNPDSEEVIIIDTQNIKDDQLTVTGSGLIKFLDQRIIRHDTSHLVQYWALTGKPANVIYAIIADQVMALGTMDSPGAYGIDGPREIITNLLLGPVLTDGDVTTYAVPFGPLFTAVQSIAAGESIGIKLVTNNVTESGYELIFSCYIGRDLTSDQDDLPVVRFEPSLGSLGDTEELYSIAAYKNVAYGITPNFDPTTIGYSGIPVAYADADAETSIDFARRVLQLSVDDITSDEVGGDPTVYGNMMVSRLTDALAQNNFVRQLDGTIIPQSAFKYGIDYKLGDVIELKGVSGITQKARITEYIRSQDNTGEHAYPTISVIPS